MKNQPAEYNRHQQCRERSERNPSLIRRGTPPFRQRKSRSTVGCEAGYPEGQEPCGSRAERNPHREENGHPRRCKSRGSQVEYVSVVIEIAGCLEGHHQEHTCPYGPSGPPSGMSALRVDFRLSNPWPVPPLSSLTRSYPLLQAFASSAG